MAITANKINIVRGTITDGNKRPLAGLKVQLHDVDMRNWQQLAETITNADGRYEMAWTPEQLSGPEVKTADIAIRVLSATAGTELYKSSMDEVRFNAREREEINITIAQPLPKERIEFDSLLKEVQYLAEKVPVEELQENKENRDVTFLSNELEVPAERIEYLAVAHRLHKLSEADASFFYALFRKNTLLNNDLVKNGNARLRIGIDDDDRLLLLDASLLDKNKIEEDIKQAVKEMIVNTEVLKNLPRNIEILARYRKEAEAYYQQEHPQKVAALVTGMLNPKKMAEVNQLFKENINTLNVFFEKITDPAFFVNGKTDNIKGDDYNKLFDDIKKAVPAIIKDNNIKREKDISRLARFNKARWVEEINKTNPALKDNPLVSTYASAIVRRFESAFPTAAFTAQLERSTETVLENQNEIVGFLNQHEDFDLVKSNIDLFLKEKDGAKKAAVISNELKSVQRVFKLIPHYGKTMGLRKENMSSAFQIASVGEKHFINEVAPKAGLSEAEAKQVYQKAATRQTAAMMLIGDLTDAMSVLKIDSFETAALAQKIEAVSKDFPNLKTLFKLVDSCEVEHCRSVYSPAAYLVEILQFLDKRAVTTGNAKSVLFNRRPDLGDIDLGCENANTPVKYVDLVCEILEEAIAPDPGIDYTGNLTDGADPSDGKISAGLLSALTAAKLPVTAKALVHETEVSLGSALTLPHYLRDEKLVCKIVNTGGNNYKVYRLRQTMSSAEELDAAPEYVNAEAYNKLRTKNYAFTLPFDLPHTEAKAYFDRFGISRAELMKAFQLAAGPTEEAIAAEYAGITDGEKQLIVNTPLVNDNAAQQAFWNVPAPGDVVSYLKQVDHFLDKTGLSFKDTALLIKLRFIKKNKDLFIYNTDLSCDTATKEIKNVDLDVFDRMHRFLRLKKKTGWGLDVLDEVISQPKLGKENLNDDCIKVIAALKKIIAKTGLKIEELICCYGAIPHTLLPFKKTTLYDGIFQNKARNGATEPALLAENVTANEAAVTKKQLTEVKAAVSTCIGIKETDFDKLLPALPNGDISFQNLSSLYALARLIKKLKLKTEDYFILTGLTGINVLNSPLDTVNFIDAVEKAGKLNLQPADMRFMLRHEAVNLTEREMKPEKIKSLLESLQSAYQKSFNDNRSLYNNDLTAEAQKEALRAQLSRLSILTETDVNIILNFVDRNWKFTWIDDKFIAHNGTTDVHASTFIDDKKIAALFDVTLIKNSLNALATAVAPNLEAKQKDFIKAWLDALSAYQFKTEKPVICTTAIAAAFKANTALADIVLKNAKLKQVAPGTDVLQDLLLTDTLIDTAAITIAHPLPVLPAVTEGTFANQYAALRLLHKLFQLVSAFQISNEQTEWFLRNNKTYNWFQLDAIPFAAAQTPVAYTLYQQFSAIVDLMQSLPEAINPADPERPVTFFSVMELTQTAVMQDAFMQALALLTGYEKEDLKAIDGYFFTTFDKLNYTSEPNLTRLLDCADKMRKLSATVSQITNYIKPVLNAADVAILRTNLKTRYDETTWLDTLKEIMDRIRPQKRNALVTYLLATNADIKDENDLYEYFLVDVEMGSCMPSSRIVLAHNSVQLFVQRCLMGLEPDAIADIDKDPSWNQWKWMKNYRVWEANRKIFLYPENWYDVTLADDKSFLLSDLINELQQNELTNDTAEGALRNYLEKLDNIAFLEVKATWYDVPSRTMHVFARTKGGDPAIYYYRKFEKEKEWTAWEKVELDIQGDQVLAFIRNNRLHLAWLVFSEEAKPDQKSKVPSAADQGTEVDPDKPEKKLIIQLAISEYSNKKWQPKRVSRDSIATPGTYTADYSLLKKEIYNLIYVDKVDQIYIFSDVDGYYVKNGVFDIAGCKGYPEKVFEGNEYLPDFLPDFKDTLLTTQRYNEENVWTAPDDLSVKNGAHPFTYLQLLNATPGKNTFMPGRFRISYPHQMTALDLVSMLFQLFQILMNAQTKTSANHYNDRMWKIPLGTLLPYFMEDSWHSYVIIPGFYKEEIHRNGQDVVTGLNDSQTRTAGDVFQLMDDIVNWFKKMMQQFTEKPPADMQEAIKIIVSDADFQAIVQELTHYKALHPWLEKLIGKTGDDEFDKDLEKLLAKNGLAYGEQFKNMYHPLVCAIKTILYKDGVPGLMKRDTQLMFNKAFNFKTHYQPNELAVVKAGYKQKDGTTEYSFPIEDIDFSSDGSYSLYNWDIFFRAPLHIAGNLTRNQRFEEALTWYHYMFNPTGALSGTGVQKYWVTKPFYLNQEADYIAQRIDSLMLSVADKNTPDLKDLEFAIDQWRNKPFRPDVVARRRPVAYQKALLMKYIDNLMEWGDYLFRQDTMETVAQATQMYVLADKLLGPKPRVVPAVVKAPYETYNQIEAKLDHFGNALLELENFLPDVSVLPEGGAELPSPSVTLSMLYFGIPQNEKMIEIWDRVADRLYKIRHCQNIDGIERSLALFAPPIDPGMLVKAAASGLDISAILGGMNAPVPFYRFNVISQKATELAMEVRTLGSSLLQALEKKDAESIALLRSELELKVLNAVKDIKKLQISESKEQIEVLQRTKKVTQERQKFYKSVQKISSFEQLNLDKLKESNDYQVSAQVVRTIAGALRLIPEFHVGAEGFGGSPTVVMQLGGSAISGATNIAADILSLLGSIASYEAGRAGTLGGYERRFEDWKLQERLASKELDSIDKQIAAAQIRKSIAETDLKNHELQIDNAKKTDDFMRSKFTNKELYDWMLAQISGVYFKSYQLAHDVAKKAERSYRFELGNTDTFIAYGYWDSMKKGLQAADNLIHDIKRMETSYLDKNKREYEVTKHVSLALLDPLALVKLRATGVCDFEIPEALYDMDHPGQYFRRIKSVSISLPCIAGPYTSVSSKLSLIKNKYRKIASLNNVAGTGYAEDTGNDERFVYNVGAIQSIATSNAQNDSGIFELNFRDERYLPFEGTGAISSWRLELPAELRQFDYNTIADVILHVKYTAREGGAAVGAEATSTLSTRLSEIKQALSETGLHVAVNMKYEMPNEWHLLKQNGQVDVTIAKSALPYMVQTINTAAIDHVVFIAKVKGDPDPFTIKINNADKPLAQITDWHLCKGVVSGIVLDTAFPLKVDAGLADLEELMMVVNYVF
ncbi:neuraminidase-like domain-containing protein [Niastella sp. OAS944]|uniref:Tc toxin subunit A-related protein n=1 Tax=Niastella sp. OAS944 TaxID=2664089 RepID=UPI00346F87CB|nr:hypothetical protein [Chitinophagaceae bacterium OAS944]